MITYNDIDMVAIIQMSNMCIVTMYQEYMWQEGDTREVQGERPSYEDLLRRVDDLEAEVKVFHRAIADCKRQQEKFKNLFAAFKAMLE